MSDKEIKKLKLIIEMDGKIVEKQARKIHELDSAVRLLELAKCPDVNCVDGAIPHQIGEDEWEAEQCQWCYEKNQLIGNKTECKHGESMEGCCNACADSGNDPRKDDGHYIGLDRVKDE